MQNLKSCLIILPALSLASGLANCAQADFPPECPRKGNLEIIESPSNWADQCFKAINGRLPSLANPGETDLAYRDIDLDGVAERLEIRGTGNAMKQIYVFKTSAEGFLYVGELNAHPRFEVITDREGKPLLKYIHRFGVDDLREQQIRYQNGEFIVINAQ